jgi:trehalose 6-phosphate phosphatase
MDGTISHFAETPEAAIVTPRNRDLLSTLVMMLPLVSVVSGRAVRDLYHRIAIPGIVCIGNHGLETWINGERHIDETVRRYRPSIVAAIEELQSNLTVGMWIEDKYATATLHYRMTPNPHETQRKLAPLMQEIAERHGLVTHGGNRLFELRPPVNKNKGTALEKLVTDYDLDAVLYIGDDLTDVDALKVAHELRIAHQCYGVGIGVMSKDNPSGSEISAVADVVANGVQDVEHLLGWLAEAVCEAKIS